MSNANFHVKEHVIPGQHIRHYYRSTAVSQEALVQLCVKQYTPKHAGEAQPGDVTILACHASGYPKELYEPIWDGILENATRTVGGFRIRNVWIVDVSNQNASGVLNEHLLGNEPSWFDHARDLLAMVNHFRAEMPRPIVGFGHSMGATVIINLALLHPRLLSTIFAIEPIINKHSSGMNFVGLHAITNRRDTWTSRTDAESFFRKSLYCKSWDARIMQLWLHYGLRKCRNNATPHSASDPKEDAVMLVTTADQEALSFGRASYPKFGESLSSFVPSWERHVDIGVGSEHTKTNPFYRPEATMTFQALPRLRPSCFFLYGESSHMASANAQGRLDKREITGTANDGSGGIKMGRVQDKVIKGSHFCPFEHPYIVAKEAALWFQSEITTWRDAEEKEQKQWKAVPLDQRAMVDEDWGKWLSDVYGRRKAASTKQNVSSKL